jgi:DnaJ-class molecular chaperone
MATRKVKDTQLYDVLGVSSEATDIEYAPLSRRRCSGADVRLKKAYRKMAIKVKLDSTDRPGSPC